MTTTTTTTTIQPHLLFGSMVLSLVVVLAMLCDPIPVLVSTLAILSMVTMTYPEPFLRFLPTITWEGVVENDGSETRGSKKRNECFSTCTKVEPTANHFSLPQGHPDIFGQRLECRPKPWSGPTSPLTHVKTDHPCHPPTGCHKDKDQVRGEESGRREDCRLRSKVEGKCLGKEEDGERKRKKRGKKKREKEKGCEEIQREERELEKRVMERVERREKIKREHRERIEREARRRFEEELKEKAERERREKEEKEKLVREIREKVEKERREKEEREVREKEKKQEEFRMMREKIEKEHLERERKERLEKEAREKAARQKMEELEENYKRRRWEEEEKKRKEEEERRRKEEGEKKNKGEEKKEEEEKEEEYAEGVWRLGPHPPPPDFHGKGYASSPIPSFVPHGHVHGYGYSAAHGHPPTHCRKHQQQQRSKQAENDLASNSNIKVTLNEDLTEEMKGKVKYKAWIDTETNMVKIRGERISE
ncbi:hypothetical protein IE53DRAFT_138663 [Violaceomyces palustris]|uniref:Uncharacterized protein n=1 Tax=Violaceomyces palustris TaxID=1673888 RepID=A0ACD0NUP9_9BASI|nr:hypothetical protein IE53DRAFT_138663 [Violaceomyces palustris]